jgi:hypothetical protein
MEMLVVLLLMLLVAVEAVDGEVITLGAVLVVLNILLATLVEQPTKEPLTRKQAVVVVLV